MTAPRPFLKWAGGKADDVEQLAARLPWPNEIAGYAEPFLGGAALFFALYRHVRPARLSDANEHLIAAFVAVRDEPAALARRLDLTQPRYGRDRYLDARLRLNEHATNPMPLVERAAAVFVVIKWGYNGLWRVNGSGEINTPFGAPSHPGAPAPRLYDAARLRACSTALAGVELDACDYMTAVARARPRELYYLDPPYAPVSATSNFTSYTAERFLYAREQPRLLAACEELHRAGALFALSNSAAPQLAPFRRRWVVESMTAQRDIAAKRQDRGEVDEILVRNFTTPDEAMRARR